MRFWYAKIYLKGGISDIKIGQKSGNLDKAFLHFGGSDGRYISLYYYKRIYSIMSDKLYLQFLNPLILQLLQ